MAQIFTLIPEYEFVDEENYKTQQTPFDFGYVQTRAYWDRPKRVFRLHWDAATRTEYETLISFFRDHVGPAGWFYYSPVDPIASPHRYGDPGQTPQSVGSYGSRTYYFALSWITGSGETLISPEGSFSISANYLFTLTVPKFWYDAITHCGIYVGTSSGNLTKQVEVGISGEMWTEPDGGGSNGLVSGDSPPTSNTATETVMVHLMEDTLNKRKVSAVSYSVDLAFEELFAVTFPGISVVGLNKAIASMVAFKIPKVIGGIDIAFPNKADAITFAYPIGGGPLG